MEKVRIVLLCCVAAAMYGIAQDQITVRVCTEYFTIAHPQLFPTASRTLLALCWGIAGSVWVGAAFGVVLASVSESDGHPPLPVRRLCTSVAALLGAMAMSSVLAGFIAFQLSLDTIISIPEAVARAIPSTAHDHFMAVWFAHIASYLAGFIGGAVLIYRAWRERGRPRAISLFPRTRFGTLRALTLGGIAVGVFYFRMVVS